MRSTNEDSNVPLNFGPDAEGSDRELCAFGKREGRPWGDHDELPPPSLTRIRGFIFFKTRVILKHLLYYFKIW